MCGSLFLRSFPISLCIFLLSIMLHCTTKRPVWAIHCRHSPKILKDGQKTEDLSLHFVRLSTMYLLDSPFTKNDFGNDELIHRLTLQQSADVLVQKHGYQ